MGDSERVRSRVNRDRGSVWWGPAPHKGVGGSYRPWLLLNTDSHPFAAEECIVAALTSKKHESGLEIAESDWIEGGSDTQSFVSPWYVMTVKKADLDRWQGRLTQEAVSKTAARLHQYVPLETGPSEAALESG